MICRLQLGVSRLETLEPEVLATFLDDTWLHLGDEKPASESKPPSHYLRLFRKNPVAFVRRAARKILGSAPAPKRTPSEIEKMYARTHFRAFYFEKGDKLDFDDESFDYIFSEHFLHHLFFDEAFALLEECHRVLKTQGLIRLVVPDADLRTYEPPEPVGFPDLDESFLAPLKHKTRYSVYMLAEMLRLAGFDPVPLRYCDRSGAYIRNDPAQMLETYGQCAEKTLAFDLGHIMRLDSLIVDGLKRPSTPRCSWEERVAR
jgi:predicted SAM-dependent methyltransferase